MRTYTLNDEMIELDFFIQVNECFTDEDKAKIAALKPGDSIVYGGGAASEFVLKRLS
jgi:hypothetical protein